MNYTNDIYLINMPYAAVEHPSLALGLVQNYLAAFGYQVETLYANLDFAKTIGLARYIEVDGSFHEDMLGEWTFSRIAFGEGALADNKFSQSDDDYFALIAGLTDEMRHELIQIRELAEVFIDDLATQIIAKQPKIIGCTSTFQQNCASLALLRKVKTRCPNIITLMGGANCDGIMGQTISKHFDWVDYVFSGECDEVIGEFVDQLLKGTEFDYHNLPQGVIGQKQPLITDAQPKPPRGYVEDMRKVGSPDYDDYFAAVERLGFADAIEPGLLMETSRGCWWGAKRHCTFCGLNGDSMTHRSKTPDQVIDEMQQLSEKYKINKFEVVDNILPAEYVDTVMPRLSQAHNYTIFYETKANLRPSHIQQLAEAGVRWIQPGFESLHDEFLRTIKKGTTGALNISALKACRESGVRVSWNILCGAPHEKPIWYHEMAQVLPLVFHLQPPYKNLIKIRYPRYSPYHNRPQDFGLTFAPIETYRHIYPLSGQNLADIAYFFYDINEQKPASINVNNPQNVPEFQLIQDEIDHWRSLFWGTKTPPILMMIDHGTSIRILDTRPIATKLAHSLTGLTADIYRICIEPVSESRLPEKLTQAGFTFDKAELTEALETLLDNKLILHISHCYLSLALSGTMSSIPSDKDHPGGSVNLEQDIQPLLDPLEGAG